MSRAIWPFPGSDAADDAVIVRSANGLVSALLRSPAHRILSRSTALIRYEGRRSRRTITTPVQYARSGDELLILVARHETKKWWRNFVADFDLDVLVEGDWVPMTGRAIVGAEQLHLIAPLLDAYFARFRRASAALGEGSREDHARNAVIVQCRPQRHR